jgi:ribosomal protein S18 acetylase RimI-like enzyme
LIVTREANGEVLRRASIDDAPAISTLTRQAYAKWVPLIGREPLPMLADYVAAVQKHRIDLLYVDGELAALIQMIPEPLSLLIENVAVSPAFQRRGLGRRLLAHAEEVALSLGYDEVRLYTNERFVGNVALYLKLGYRIDHEEEFRGSPARAHEQAAAGPSSCYLLHVAMTVEPLSTDHWFWPALTTVKQLSFEPFQVVQKPSLESFQVPSPRLPPPIGSRFILPSAENVILNLRLDGVEAVNGWPLKNVARISVGDSLAAGAAKADAPSNTTRAPPMTAPAKPARIVTLPIVMR